MDRKGQIALSFVFFLLREGENMELLIIILSVTAVTLMCMVAYSGRVRYSMVLALNTALVEFVETEYDKFIDLELIWVCQKLGFNKYRIFAIESSTIKDPESLISGMVILCKTEGGIISKWYV